MKRLTELRAKVLRLLDDACPPDFYAQHDCEDCDEEKCLECWIEWLPECGDGQGWMSNEEHRRSIQRLEKSLAATYRARQTAGISPPGEGEKP